MLPEKRSYVVAIVVAVAVVAHHYRQYGSNL